MSLRARISRSTGFTVLLATAILGSCATINTGSHFDETANFAAYRSFAWIADEPLISADTSIPVSALLKSRIRSAIQRELESKGYQFSDDRENADFVVAYTIGTREAISVDAYPVNYRGRWGWHVPYSYYNYREITAHTYTRGTLAVDIFENDSRKPIWHGWAEKTITASDRQDPASPIQEAVSKLFADFPR